MRAFECLRAHFEAAPEGLLRNDLIVGEDLADADAGEGSYRTKSRACAALRLALLAPTGVVLGAHILSSARVGEQGGWELVVRADGPRSCERIARVHYLHAP
jgi:hypothetical protein